jgi:hypothetical protein
MTAPLLIRLEDGFAPDRLWSLWDMLDHNAEAFCRFSSIIGQVIIGLQFGQMPNVKVITESLAELQREAKRIGLASVDAQIERINKHRSIAHVTSESWHELYHRMQDELKSAIFLAVSEDKAKYYSQDEPLFGQDVANKFPSANYDIEEAGKCYALERSTASAFHSIRSLEAAIRALSRCLGIPDPTRASSRNWGAMLKEMKTEIDRRWPGSTSKISGDGEFFDAAYAALAATQNPWRNSTMHLDQKYTPDEALHVMDVVRGFMKKLASRMDEDGKPLV